MIAASTTVYLFIYIIHVAQGDLADYSIALRGSFPSAVAAMSLMHECSGQFRTELEHDPAKIGEILQQALRRTPYFDGELPDGMCNCSCCGAGCSCHGGESHECRNPYSLKQVLIAWRGAVEREKKSLLWLIISRWRRQRCSF